MKQEANQQAAAWLKDLRHKQAKSGKTLAGTRHLSEETKELIAAQTDPCVLLREDSQRSQDVLFGGLEWLEEMARRRKHKLTEALRPHVSQLFLAEWHLNAATYATTLEKALPFTLYNGAVDLKADPRLVELLEAPGLFKEAIFHYRTSGAAEEFLKTVLKKMHTLRKSLEFESLEHIEGIFKHAVISYPKEDHAEKYLRRVMEIIEILEKEETLSQLRKKTPWLIGYAARHHIAGDSAKDFLMEIQKVCALGSYKVNEAIELGSARRKAIIARATLL